MRVECFESPGKKINTKTNIKSLKNQRIRDNYAKKKIDCSYRMTQAKTFETQQKKSLQNMYLIYKRIICAVDMHRKAMKLVFMQK